MEVIKLNGSTNAGATTLSYKRSLSVTFVYVDSTQ